MDLRIISHLHGRARVRKIALLLERLEREQAWSQESHDFLISLARFLLTDTESSQELMAASRTFLDGLQGRETMERAVNAFRHACMRISGQAPADWDFIKAPRPVHLVPQRPGMRVYLEDIRSPFNVGSIFRTAEALGFEEVLLSPECADPFHPRAIRSAMGAIEMLPWRRMPLEGLAGMDGVFALEVGGEPLDTFEFPSEGIMVLGSEELGVSLAARALCNAGIVHIPMVGKKASLNVATAFGIAAYRWLTH